MWRNVEKEKEKQEKKNSNRLCVCLFLFWCVKCLKVDWVCAHSFSHYNPLYLFYYTAKDEKAYNPTPVSQEMQRKKKRKRINYLAQEKEMNAETKAVICRDEERANKKSHYY